MLGKPTGAPIGNPVAEVVAVAKKDLSKGTTLDGLGGETVKGIIYSTEETFNNNYLPVGLTNEVTLNKSVEKGKPISMNMLEKKGDTLVWKLRELQEKTLLPFSPNE